MKRIHQYQKKFFFLKKHHSYALGFVFALLLLLSPNNLFAWRMSQKATQLDYIAKKADHICHIKVKDIQTQRANLGGQESQFNWIMTWVEPTVIQCWKGNLYDQTEFRSFGGELKGFKYDGDGMFPIFKKDEEAIVFLKSFPEGLFPVSHKFGKMTIVNDRIQETGDSLKDFIARLQGVLQ
ncbi:MAG: hypothetical protein KDK66_02715 [Deltaproteobacteria bacterium]|nr:hypothetical protein [Deltaproteobacteria bacterium]